jgi:hypothetical protein
MRTAWLHQPLLHFLVGGGLLFLAVGRPTAAPVAAAAPLLISAAEVAQMRASYTRETGLQPTAADEAALVDQALDEELLFREALARGLDRDDRSVRNWLVEQMRVLADDPSLGEDELYARALALGLDRKDLVVRRILVQKMRLLAERSDEAAVSDDALREFHRQHLVDYQLPDRIDLQHVFLRRERAGEAAHAAAQRLLVALRAAAPGAPPPPAGDAFPLPPRLSGQSRAQLEKVFGAAVAAQAMNAAVGVWLGPLDSPSGVHLLRVDAVHRGGPAPFDSVRGRVLERWREQTRAARLAELLRSLKRRYPVLVESPAWRERGAA